MGVGEAAVAFWMWFWAGVVVLAIGAGIVIGGWQAHWWFAASAVNHQYSINQNSQQYQQTYLQEITQGMVQLNRDQSSLTSDQQSGNTTLIGEDKVALAADAGKLCEYGQHINTTTESTMDSATIAWFQTNCNMGVVAPNSAYYVQTGQPYNPQTSPSTLP